MESTSPIIQPLTPLTPRRFSSQGLAQAYGIRKLVFDAIDALSNELRDNEGRIALVRDGKGQLSDAQALVSLTRAWSEADDRIRIHRGKPLPGSLRPEARKVRRPRRAERDAFEPVSAPVVPAPSEPAVVNPPCYAPATPTGAASVSAGLSVAQPVNTGKHLYLPPPVDLPCSSSATAPVVAPVPEPVAPCAACAPVEPVASSASTTLGATAAT